MLRPVCAGMPRILKGVLPVELSQKCLNYCLRSQGVQVAAPALTAVTPAKLPWRLSKSWCDSDEALVASAESSPAVCACWCGILHPHVLSRFVVGIKMLSRRSWWTVREIDAGCSCPFLVEESVLLLWGGERQQGPVWARAGTLWICAALKSTSEMKTMFF